MNLSRRDLCRAGVWGAVTIGLGACDGHPPVQMGGPQIPASVVAGPPYALSLRDFEPHVGTRFDLAGADGARTSVTLVRATDLGIAGRPVVDKAECFVLAFEAQAAAGGRLGQDTYTASHAVLGSFPIFIVPGDASSTRQTCSALFNRV
jgi:hypothetical protein